MDKQRKKIVTQAAIARSTKINQSRLQKIEARQQSLMDMTGLCEGELKNYARDKAKYQPLLVDLIVQGCLRLMEDKVLIRCKKEDEKTVAAVLEQAAQKYSQTVKRQTNADKKLSLSVDSSSYLPPMSMYISQRSSHSVSSLGSQVTSYVNIASTGKGPWSTTSGPRRESSGAIGSL